MAPRAVGAAVAFLLLAFVMGAAPPVPTARAVAPPAGIPASPSDAEVAAVAAQLRCVVCQSLSVADSPSEMASQMRGIVRERLAAGDTPEQVVQYFVDKYGEWILLAPRARGFTLLVWLVPAVAVVAGLAVTALRLRGWTRRSVATVPAPGAAMRERIRKELEAQE
jgi:cytochrome c-type biogenesis protein CcmH